LPGISATPVTFRIVLQSDSFQFGSRFLSVAFGGTSCSKSDALSCGAAFPTATASCLQGFTREPCTADNRMMMIRKISTRQDAKFVLNKCWPGTGVAAQQSSPRLFASATSLACCSARSHSATQSRSNAAWTAVGLCRLCREQLVIRTGTLATDAGSRQAKSFLALLQPPRVPRCSWVSMLGQLMYSVSLDRAAAVLTKLRPHVGHAASKASLAGNRREAIGTVRRSGLLRTR